MKIYSLLAVLMGACFTSVDAKAKGGGGGGTDDQTKTHISAAEKARMAKLNAEHCSNEEIIITYLTPCLMLACVILVGDIKAKMAEGKVIEEESDD